MSNTIISAENVSKRYIIGHQRSKDDGFRHVIEDALRAPLRLMGSKKELRPTKEEFYALKNLSFDVKQGEILGIVGRNGAGKSTLLKVLSRITEPTSGRISIRGRVASLLEVGTGFHPELTGRENIYLNGAILGMTRVEIKRKFDEIVAFSEVERFLDTPVKRYSSGMYVRLAFAVAAHLEPEILIIDEVLAVGDTQFQKKCLGKMGEVAKGGRTVLFVSHNIPAVLQLTTRCILLENGSLTFSGSPKDCVAMHTGNGAIKNQTIFDLTKHRREHDTKKLAEFTELSIERPTPTFSPKEDIVFNAKFKTSKEISNFRFSLTIYNNNNETPVGCSFGKTINQRIEANNIGRHEIRIPNHRLAPGKYHIGIAIGKGDHKTGFTDYDIVLNTLHFEILPVEGEEGTLAHWNENWGNIVLDQLLTKNLA
ncbi:ABC transporter ATP-binding protein [Pelagicoccus sp. SDUM812003]|uniref:ABC transporter ATP-binding protein n=1 Tax=Pelagicoccus sp. SDUM812003 TaxID=3041267 RepID=UPI00280F6D15|nr:ABC transporter ATP-binding protein [Pelagicoccus sp. SDUM812003]MDQ8204987.1 ABC transporter ATP-binding protein [Pelagicoccus sp. SDUM812003]